VTKATPAVPLRTSATAAPPGAALDRIFERGPFELILGEAIDRPLVDRAVDTQIRHLELPGGELGVEVLQVTELPTGKEVALDVLHSGLDLALGPGTVRLAQPGA